MSNINELLDNIERLSDELQDICTELNELGPLLRPTNGSGQLDVFTMSEAILRHNKQIPDVRDDCNQLHLKINNIENFVMKLNVKVDELSKENSDDSTAVADIRTKLEFNRLRMDEFDRKIQSLHQRMDKIPRMESKYASDRTHSPSKRRLDKLGTTLHKPPNYEFYQDGNIWAKGKNYEYTLCPGSVSVSIRDSEEDT